MPGAFEYLYDLTGREGVPAEIMVPVAGTQTLKVGDLVIISSNQIAKASASVVAPFGVMAQAAASLTAGTKVKVFPIMPGQAWRAAASADATNAVLGAITYDITSTQLVDIADSSNGSILVLETRLSITDVVITFTKSFFTSLS